MNQTSGQFEYFVMIQIGYFEWNREKFYLLFSKIDKPADKTQKCKVDITI